MSEATKTPGPSDRDVIPHQAHPALDISSDFDPDARRPTDWIVFGIAGVISIAFVLWGIFGTDSLSSASTTSFNWVIENTGWLFVLTATSFVIFVIYLAVSKYGAIPLGRDGEEPEFKTASWVAMMFSAGMGIGLMFYGVAEPMNHYMSPPPGTGDSDPKTAMATTMFHWTLHPWAIYAVVGLAIAYGVYRKGRSQSISASFFPLIGRHANGWAGKVIDIFAIFATLFGSATSLGTGVFQIKSGLQIVGGWSNIGNTMLIVIITVLTMAFVLSAVSGVGKGIQWLSNINMVLAAVLAFFLFVAGPTVLILNLVPTSIGGYFQDMAMMAARTGAEGGKVDDWLGSWTIYYWAWWMSWTPFVGMFIARISRGRTIRQFVGGVLLVPSVVSVIWFCIFGGTAIDLQDKGADIFGDGSLEPMLFSTLDHFPWAGATSVLVMILVGIFFVSGADAASIVMGTLSQRGTTDPHRGITIFWGVVTGAVAAVMLATGGEDALTGLQTITIVAALPFVLIMVGITAALMKDLRNDPMIVRQKYAKEAVKQAIISGVTEHGDDFSLAVEPSDEPVTPPGIEVPGTTDADGTSGSSRTNGTGPES